MADIKSKVGAINGWLLKNMWSHDIICISKRDYNLLYESHVRCAEIDAKAAAVESNSMVRGLRTNLIITDDIKE